MNEMIAAPIVVLLVLFTAVFSAWITTALPRVPKWWNAFKSRIKRKKNTYDAGVVANLAIKVNDLQDQIDNIAERLSNRDVNRKHNTRKIVREYLNELKND